MKKLLTNIAAVLVVLIQGCNNKEDFQIDISGTWVNRDGAMLVLNKDSSFVGKSLPAEYFTFFTSKKEVEGKQINGSGIWKINNDGSYNEVKLIFKQRDNQALYGSYSVYIAGENGLFDNSPPRYLFVWQEEGGERYKFTRQP